VKRFRAESTTGIVSKGAAKLWGWNIINTGATAVYVKFYDLAEGETLVIGTTPVVTTRAIGANSADIESDAERLAASAPIDHFLRGIKYAVTTGASDGNTAVPGAAPLCEILFDPIFGDAR
jgi:hypothetical protein